MPISSRDTLPSDAFEDIVEDIIRRAGWQVHRHPAVGEERADFLANAGGRTYIIEVKGASEGRRDRLIPLLSQAILQAQEYARQSPEPAIPLAVVAAGRISASVAEHLKQFAKRYAPDTAVGIIDAEGFRSFVGPGLEGLEGAPSRAPDSRIAQPQHIPDLFSDLNQWMLKILLGQSLPEPLISVPRGPFRHASQLAAAAQVSVMSASRFVNQLLHQGFLDEHEPLLRIARIEELLDQWASASRHTAKEIPARWIIKGGHEQLRSALREYADIPEPNLLPAQAPHSSNRRRPDCCLALFAAADALGVGFVQGVQPRIYLERLTLDSLHRLGLRVDDSNRPADVYIRIPVNREQIFRARVRRDGVPVSDILQVWLDVSTHPARGREQAREIHRHILKPLFGKQA